MYLLSFRHLLQYLGYICCWATHFSHFYLHWFCKVFLIFAETEKNPIEKKSSWHNASINLKVYPRFELWNKQNAYNQWHNVYSAPKSHNDSQFTIQNHIYVTLTVKRKWNHSFRNNLCQRFNLLWHGCTKQQSLMLFWKISHHLKLIEVQQK